MSGSPFSASWYRVAELTPRLRSHIQIHRHQYRGEPSYLLQDLSNQRFHRFNAEAYTVIGLMDGQRTSDEIWHITNETLGDDAPTQDEMIRLLGQLHSIDALQSDVSPDSAELLERHEKKERRELQGKLLNPFAIKVPLIDPERFLVASMPVVRPLLGWVGLLIWLSVVIPAIVLAATNWTELTEGVFDRVLSADNLLVVWLTFPVLKTLHEFGHGYLCRRFGGEVHEMGVMFLVFTPVPYVDASSANAFASKWKRMIVDAGGMIVEVFLAAVAMLLWVSLEAGLARTIAFNLMLIGGITTLLFNANPLLRFDGYYILADWLEIPNLRARSNAFMRYLLERYAFGHRDADLSDDTPSERAWFVLFAVAAFFYRFVVMAAILLFLLDRSFVLGVLLISVAMVSWLGMPLFKAFRYLANDVGIRKVRGRAIGVVATASGLILLLVGILPFPYRTSAEGVVWLADEAQARAESPGFIAEIMTEPGARVELGAPLFRLRSADLSKEIDVQQARLRELDARFQKTRPDSEARAQQIREEIRFVQQSLERAREREADLTVRSRQAGLFVVPHSADLIGRHARQGQVLGHVLDLDRVTVRAVVSPEEIDLVREDTQRVDVRLAERLWDVLPASIIRSVPKATEWLPSPALGTNGGGRIALDPRAENADRALQKHFQIELSLPPDTLVTQAGGRVYVRFDHGYRPLVTQWYRTLRQTFLARFDV